MAKDYCRGSVFVVSRFLRQSAAVEFGAYWGSSPWNHWNHILLLYVIEEIPSILDVLRLS
jgi:hypothetical protein